MTEYLIEENSSVKNINNLQERLLSIINSDSDVILDFMHLKRTDLAVAQLLVAAVKYARKNEVSLKLKNISSELKSQLYLTGLLKRDVE